jgi:PhnO protein
MQEENYTIRKVEEKDMLPVYEQICELEELQLDFNDFQSAFIFNIQDDAVLYYIAENNEQQIIGFISCHIQHLLHHGGKVAEIQELFVKPAFRKMGIGNALVRFMEALVKKRQCVSFEVTAQNKRNQTHEFYKNLGFIQSHLKFTKSK